MKAALLLLLCCAAHAHAQDTHALIVTGVAGEPRLAQQFQRDAGVLRDALVQRFSARTTLLTESSTPRSDKAAIGAALQRLAADAKPGDRVLIVFIGHGSAQGGTPRINIPGPDVTADELASLLNALDGCDVAVVLATSASGAFLPALEKPGRSVIAATRSGAESEEVVFAQHFARALSEDVADADKDGGVSLVEAYEYSKREVARYYQQEKRLATEHAVLYNEPVAKGFVLRSGSLAVANPELRDIQQRIDALKARKSSMSADAYETELEKLLLELARKTRELRDSGKQD